MSVTDEIKIDDLKELVVGTVTTSGMAATAQPNSCPTVSSQYELSDRGPIRYVVPGNPTETVEATEKIRAEELLSRVSSYRSTNQSPMQKSAFFARRRNSR